MGENMINGFLNNSSTDTSKIQKTFSVISSQKKTKELNAANNAIAVRLSSKTQSYAKAYDNLVQSTSRVQIADSLSSEITMLRQQQRDLAVKAANGIYTGADRQALQQEANAISDQINFLTKTTTFNGQQVADNPTLSVQGGINATDSFILEVNVPERNVTVNLSSQASAKKAITDLDAAIDEQVNAQTNIGSSAKRIESAIRNTANTRLNTEATYSRLVDTDNAKAAADLVKNAIQIEAQISVHKIANQLNKNISSLFTRN